METLGVLCIGLGLLGIVWDIWHLLSGKPLPGFLGYRHVRRGLFGKSLRSYASLHLVGSIGLVVFGLGSRQAIPSLFVLGAVLVGFGIAVDVVVFAPVWNRK